MLLDPAAAESLILSHLPTLPSEACALLQAHGRILRESVRADRPLPPYDRVTMDGYALRSAAFAAGGRRFRITGLQAAGAVPLEVPSQDACIEIATGAVLPEGADAVVPYELTQREGDMMTVTGGATLVAGTNVHRRGSDHPEGEVLLRPGTRLGGGELAVAATCGAAQLVVAAQPRIALVATGDELAEVEATEIAPHQIRRSNDYALRAALLQSGLSGTVERVHLRDRMEEVQTGLRRLLDECDVLLLTGGVSKGRFDLLPEALETLGVRQVLRGVAQRPGKPLWFGISSRGTPVFALPGNPVSAYTCLHRYVLPALARLAGAPAPRADFVALAEPVSFAAKLTYFLPAVLNVGPDGSRRAIPAPFHTSGDVGGLLGTDGFVELPPEPSEFAAGTVARFWRWT